LLISILALAKPGYSQQLKALFNYKTFYAPGNGPYIESYLSVDARTVQYQKQSSGKFSGAIEVSIFISDGTGTKYSDKYNLLSPEVSDSSSRHFSFLDQQRIQLANGTYKFEMVIRDKSYPDKPYSLSQTVKVEYYPNLVAVSDISLIESYAKTETENPLSRNGFDMVPYVDNYFPPSMKTLRFYAEIYNSDKVFSESAFLISYFIKSAESGKTLENLRGFKKDQPAPVRALFTEIPLQEVSSGNYILVVEVRNQQNEIVASKEVAFQRNNNLISNDAAQTDLSNTFVSFFGSKDTLSEYIRCLRPLCNSIETTFLTNQLKLADLKLMQNFFYDFWTKRNPANPEKAWLDYRAEVLRVNNDFSTSMERGYDTDRGRVYLQYGRPNTITKSYNEPSAYPYEIWHYYKIGSQSNRKFVFYNMDLVSNDFILLHSDAQGEPYDNQWELKLHKRDTQSNDYDDESKNPDYFGNKAKENFINPK
jgi:GWxTD domain-containing protein